MPKNNLEKYKSCEPIHLSRSISQLSFRQQRVIGFFFQSVFFEEIRDNICFEEVQELNIDDFMRIGGMERQQAYETLKYAAKLLREASMDVPSRLVFDDVEDIEDDRVIVELIAYIRYNRKTHSLVIKFTKEFVKCLKNLGRGEPYFIYPYPMFCQLDSKYSQNLFRLCASWQKIGKRTFTDLRDLRDVLGASCVFG